MIRIALPNKGRLSDDARRLLERAGLRFESRSARALQAQLGDDFQALFVRARDIPEFVADGAADLGVTGRDLVLESRRHLEQLLDLRFGRCRLVVAGVEDGPCQDVGSIPSGAPVATSFPNIAGEFFAERGQDVNLVPVSGAAEIAPHIGVADFIVDLVSTGSTLKTNGLTELATICESSAVLVGREEFVAGDRGERTARELVDALESVIRARDKRYLMANVPRSRLEEVKRVLPGLSGPTVVDILDGDTMVAAHAVVDQSETYRVIGKLRALGAEGILVTKIERLAP